MQAVTLKSLKPHWREQQYTKSNKNQFPDTQDHRWLIILVQRISWPKRPRAEMREELRRIAEGDNARRSKEDCGRKRTGTLKGNGGDGIDFRQLS